MSRETKPPASGRAAEPRRSASENTSKGRRRSRVVKVSIEVSNGAARFAVAVRAQSIRRAVSLVAGRYPEGDCRVKFLIDPEGFFAEAPAARAGIVEFEQPRRMAA